MKSYPSITSTVTYDTKVHVFNKIDGSQIRAEWSRKRGFYKLGSRRQLIDEDTVLGAAKGLLEVSFVEPLGRIFTDKKLERAVCFFEISGDQSFAGRHVPGDPLRLTLFDVAPYKKGIMLPEDFLDVFGHLNVPACIFKGMLTEDFVEDIRSSTTLDEGVVCKGSHRNNQVLMFKIKTRAWIRKLRALCGEDEARFKELL